MLPLDKAAAIERIIGEMKHWFRVTYTATDARGRVDYVRDIPAESAHQAALQAEWSLEHDHPHDWPAYVFDRMERIERTRPHLSTDCRKVRLTGADAAEGAPA